MTRLDLSHNSFPSEAIDQWDPYEEPLDDPLDDSFGDPSQGQTQTNELNLCQHDDSDDGKRGILPVSAYCTENIEQTGVLSFQCNCNAQSQDTNFCDVCSQIDFGKLFGRKIFPRRPETVFNLGHIMKSNCPLCRFLRACCPENELNEDSLSRFWLVFGRASPVFGSYKLCETPVLQIYFRSTTSLRAHYACRLILPVHGQPGVSGRHLTRERIDEENLKDWLKICEEYHPTCQSNVEADIAGMQIIDCITKLVIPFSKETAQYLALSYVWGSACHEVAEFQPRRLGQLPKVIEDAILLVCRLGFRYLWIDRYCIPQDDKTAKLIQIQNMGNIYANSTLTIIAAAGTTPEYGIPGVDSTPRSEELSVRAGSYCLVGINRPKVEIGKTKWNTRGWTYQEALLSKRRLVLTSSQAYFQCQGMHCTESYSVDLRALHSQKRVLHEKVDFGRAFPSPGDLRKPRTISDRINEFLDRDLSFDSDTLDAIAGILRIYRDLREPINFFCGLPIFSKASSVLKDVDSMTDILVEALLWDAPNDMVRRPEFPSWSWVGWKHSKITKDDRSVYHYDVFEYFPYCRDQIFPACVIQAEYSNNTVLEWESNYQLILKMSDSANYPRSLSISGWTFSAQVTWEDGWQLIFPPPFAAKPIRLLDIGLSPDRIHNVLGLILTHTRSGCFRFLLLKLTQDCSSFERISYEHQEVEGAITTNPNGENAVLGDLQVTWDRIHIQ